MMHNQRWKAVLPWGLIAVVLYNNLGLAFVEGDDASTILYHAANREATIQKPYSPYQSFFDWLLAWLPHSDVAVLKGAALFLSVLGGIMILIVIQKIMGNKKPWFLFVLLLAIPEWLLMMLYINPAILASGFMGLAFFWVLQYMDKKKSVFLIVGSISMGLAIALRWNFIMGLSVFIPLLAMDRHFNWQVSKWHWRLLFKNGILVFAAASIVTGFALIWVSGYSVIQFFEIVFWGQSYMAKAERHPVMYVSSMVAFFTPASVALMALGVFSVFVSKKWGVAVLFIFGFLPFVLLSWIPSFKFNLPAILPLVLLIGLGYDQIMKGKPLVKISFASLLILPWVVGLQVPMPETAWAPELTMVIPVEKKAEGTEANTDILKKIRLSLKSGNAMPNLEGVRPLFGFGDALLNGSWGAFNRARAEERNELVQLATNAPCLLFADRPVALIQMAFVEKGYQLLPPQIQEGNVWQRRLLHPETGQSTTLITPGDFISVADFSQLITRERSKNQDNCGLYFLTYSSLTPALQNYQPQSIALSATTGKL
jgi:hypothetical protein